MKKTVTLMNREGHQFYPEYGTGWSDTWVEFHKGRRKIYIGPCLHSLTSIENERKLYSGDPDLYGWTEPILPEGNWDFCLPDKEHNREIPDILINSEWVTKAGIEGAVKWYLREYHGVTAEIRWRWKKNKKRFFLIPV